MALDLEKIDLGGFGISKEADTKPEVDTQLRANMDEALKINPDQHAKTTTLSQESGVPAFAVESDPAKVEHGLKLDNIDFSEMSKRSPNTAKYLTDFNNSIIAQDDVDVMQSIESTLAFVPGLNAVAPTLNFLGDITPALKQGSVQTVKGLGRGLEVDAINMERTSQEPLRSSLMKAAENAVSLTPEEVKKLPVEEGQLLPSKENFLKALNDKREQWVTEQFDKSSDTFERFGLPLVKTPDSFLKDVGQSMSLWAEETIKDNPEWQRSPELLNRPWTELLADPQTRSEYLARSIGENIPNLVAGIGAAGLTGFITKNPALAIEASVIFTHTLEAGFSFDELVKLTGDKKAAAQTAHAVGMVNSILETIPIGRLLNVTPGLKNVFLRHVTKELGTKPVWRKMITEGFKQASAEGVTEGLQEVVSNVGKSFYKDNQDLFEGVTESMFIGSLLGGGAGVVSQASFDKTATVKNDVEKKESKGNVEQNKIDQLNEQSEKSKLRERDKESFKQFVEQADGDNNTTVFIDGAQTSLYLQSKTPGEIKADPALKLLAEQAREASELGTDIQVPVAEFAAEIAGTEHYANLRESMTLSDETVSPFRQEQVKQETETYVNNLVEEASQNASQYVEAQNIYETVREQLIDSGTVTPANASIMSQIVPAWATAQAARQGKTVQQIYQDSGLIVEGPQTGEKARLQGEQVLEQQNITTADLKTQLQSDGIDVQLRGEGNVVTLDKIVVPQEQRETGIGTAAMQRIIDWADANGKTVALSPSKDFGGDIGRLKQFYKGLGFIENKGKNKDLEISETMFYTPKEVLRQEGVTSEIPQQQDGNIGRRPESSSEQTLIKETKERTDQEALAEFKRAEQGEEITVVHRSHDDTTKLNDAKLDEVINKKTPSAYFGHYTGAGDVGNAQRYGNDVSVHKIQLKNPVIISEETFLESTDGMTAEEAIAKREFFKSEGHDGILIRGLNWVVAFESKSFTEIKETFEDVAFEQASVEPVSTETEAFKKWSGGGEVVESEDINDYTFKAETPTVVKVFHGTTHKFDAFDAKRGNLEGQFGAINYFTSSEQDASDNYAGEGPDLTNRIEQRAEQIEQEQEIEMDDARNIARQELSGGQEETMELFVRVDNPFVIGENAEWIEFVDNEAIQKDAEEQVADNNDITVEELNERRDEFEDEIDETRYDIEAETPNDLIEAIQVVSSRNQIEAAELAVQVYELGNEATPETIEEMLRISEDYQYAEDPETGKLSGNQLIAEVIEEMGFDSIILKNAEVRFETMSMEPGTTHVHVFDSKKTNIKSTENIGTFDPTNPNIFKQKPTKTKEARGYYDPANSIIRLTESADLSTFLHEFAHFMYEMEVKNDSDMVESINSWYKRNAEDVAKEANTYLGDKVDVLVQDGKPKSKEGSIKPDDVTTFLDNNTTGNKDKDAAIRRAVHEQFARGFETYLMEGKAPSIELRNAFRAFARWLSRIYQAFRGQLNVNLDPEMRKVFDLLLATEDQIQAAEARARVEPMFTDAAMAGMTEEEFVDYQKRQEKVKDVQSEELRDKIIKQLTRQTKTWWKEEKQDIIDEEIETLNKQQVYETRSRLKDDDIKLDHATVKEMIGEEKVNKLGRTSTIIPPVLRGMTAKGQQGVHPDEAAAFFGYNSGSEMLNDLTTAPDIKVQAEDNAEKQMIERHGDILNDGTIEQQADEAVQNEERGKLILSELKTLAKGTNAPTIDRATIKALSEERIGRLSFRQIHPGKYRKAEIRAAQESARMLAEGNKEGAAAAKMQQVMNYYLGMAATNAKNETTVIVDRMSRYNKKKVREEIQKSEGGYWDQLTRILNRFDFRKSATLKEVESLNLWVKQKMEEVGDGLVLSNAVLNESYVTHWKNVPFSDLQGISDSVKNIEHVARYSNKMTKIQEGIDFKKLKANWIDNINKQDARFKNKNSRSRIDDARKATAAEHIQRWISQLTKIPFLASWLDGGDRVGLSHDILIQPFTDALDSKMKMLDEVSKPVIEAIKNRNKEDLKRHSRKIFIPEIDDTLTGDQIVSVALNTGNAGNLKKLLLGEGWANPEIETDIDFNNPKLQAVLNHMTRSDWELVQLIWDRMETLYPQLAEVHRKTTGLVPPKVDATPFAARIGGVAGEDINMRGGYYPIKYSPKRSHKAEKNAEKLEAETESMFNNTASIQASVNTGATNERTGFYDRINLSLGVVADHFNETIHYITHHDAVRQVNKLIQSNDVADAITSVLGEAEYKELKPWLNDIAKDGRQQPVKTFIDEAFQRLRFGTTLGIMGFKASTGIMQLFGMLTTAAELGVGPTVKGIYTVVDKSFYMRAVLNLMGSQEDMQTGWDFAAERSKVLPHRVNTMDREIKNAMNRLSNKTGALAAIQEVSMKHIALIQTYMVDLPTWHAAYDKHLSENGDESLAVRFADVTVENLQGSGNVKDMARIMRNQSKIHSTFTMFMTYFSSLGNLTRDLARGTKSGQYSLTSAAAKTMFLFTLPVFFEMLLRGELDDKDDGDDDRMNKFLMNSALYPLTGVPFVRDVASGALSDFGYNSTPVAAMMERGISSGKSLVKNLMTDDEITKSQVKNVSKLAGAAIGIPGLNQMWSSGEHLFDVIQEGEEFTTRELLFGPDRK